MPTNAQQPPAFARRKRSDARRNERALLEAAAAVFVESGVQAPIRQIAAQAGVGTATVYRHFPTRADLIIAVYRYQVEGLVQAGPNLLGSSPSAHAALTRWADLFVDFLVTKHGLASVLQSDEECFDPLHSYFLERLVPVCAELLANAARAGEIGNDIEPIELMRGIGNLCIGASGRFGFDAHRLVGLLIAGLREQDGTRLA